MKKVILCAVLALAGIAHAAPADVFKRLDKQPLHSASLENGKHMSAIYALCGDGSNTTMYRVIKISQRGALNYADHIYLHLYNGNVISANRSDCKFFNIQ